MAEAASAQQAATATREDTSQQRAGRRRRTSTEPRRAQQGATAATPPAPAALDSLSRLQQLADASPRVAQLRRLQALADAHYAPVAQLAGDPEEEELVQGKFASAELEPQRHQAPRANNTGLPDRLKSGIESLSGLSMDHVRVHYNSAQPAQLNAQAYAQGSDIHLAPGQEWHLPHEAWHVVQQAQGRVRPTLQLKDGVPVNDDVGLEREADVMGTKALEGGHRAVEAHRSVSMPIETEQPIDGDATSSPELNVANNHSAPLAHSRGSAQRGGNEMQRIAYQCAQAALQRQVQAWGNGSDRVGQLRVWQRVADGRGVGGKRQVLTSGLAYVQAGVAQCKLGFGIDFKEYHLPSNYSEVTAATLYRRRGMANTIVNRSDIDSEEKAIQDETVANHADYQFKVTPSVNVLKAAQSPDDANKIAITEHNKPTLMGYKQGSLYTISHLHDSGSMINTKGTAWSNLAYGEAYETLTMTIKVRGKSNNIKNTRLTEVDTSLENNGSNASRSKRDDTITLTYSQAGDALAEYDQLDAWLAHTRPFKKTCKLTDSYSKILD